jgi:hypothetical protein
MDWFVVYKRDAHDDVFGPFPSLRVARVYIADSESALRLTRLSAGHYETRSTWLMTPAVAKQEGFDLSEAHPMASQDWWYR